MSLKLKEKINSPPLVLNILTKDELCFDLELGFESMNIEKEACGVIDFYFSFEKIQLKKGS